MRYYEFIDEAKQSTSSRPDKYGGYIKITPDPRIDSMPTKFSMSYINSEMAKFYGIQPRILGYDSHGHIGIPEPHLHGFAKRRKRGIYSTSNNAMALSYEQNIEIFYDLYEAVLKRYKRDKQNGTQR